MQLKLILLARAAMPTTRGPKHEGPSLPFLGALARAGWAFSFGGCVAGCC